MWVFFFYGIFIEKPFSMKIIVTEAQLNVIKEHLEANLDEAQAKYPKSVIDKLGVILDDLVVNIEVGTVIEFTTVRNSKFKIKCTTITNYLYTFSVIEDATNVFGGVKKLQIILVDGNSDQELYEKNAKVITFKDSSFGLKFKGMKDFVYGLKSFVFFQPPTPQPSVSASTSGATTGSTSDVTSGSTTGTTTGSTNGLQITGEEVFRLITQNKELRDAFYSKPSFWESLKAEFNGTKSPGHGILTAMGILNKYFDRKDSESLGANFIVGRTVFLTFHTRYEIDKKVVFEPNKTYKTIVDRKILAEPFKLRFKVDNETYVIFEIFERIEQAQNGFLVKGILYYKNQKINELKTTVEIDPKTSNGYLSNY